ncbi:hypothetical protein D3C81_2141920 [compost metagenome]
MHTQGLGGHRAHHRELIEVLGAAIDIGTQIQQLAVTRLGRDRRHHGWPIDTRQGFEHEA